MNSFLSTILITTSLIFAQVLTQASAFAGGMVHTKQFLAEKQKLKNLIPEAGAGKILYYGGPVMSSVKVVVVFWGNGVDSQTKSDIGGFYSALANSTHMDWLDRDYNTKRVSALGRAGTNQNIGRGLLQAEIKIKPINTGKVLEKSAVEAELVAQIDNGTLPKPDANTAYMIHFPAGMTLTTGGMASCQEWCGDHEGFTSNRYGNIYYAMMPDIGGACRFGCGFAGNTFDSLTVIASHELVEMATDPMCPNIGQAGAYPAAWISADQNEVGDLCGGSNDPRAKLITPSRTYAIQSEWDNTAGVCKGGTFTP